MAKCSMCQLDMATPFRNAKNIYKACVPCRTGIVKKRAQARKRGKTVKYLGRRCRECAAPLTNSTYFRCVSCWDNVRSIEDPYELFRGGHVGG